MSRRAYDSSRRQQQAVATQRAILDAGRRLFVERGYAATTVADIAAEAGVAPATVSAAFGGKAGLLKRIVDVAIVGDDEPVPVSEREAPRQIAREPDAKRQVQMLAGMLTEIHGRVAELYDVMTQASGADEQVRDQSARYQEQRRDGMAEFVAMVDPAALRLDAEAAADVVWALGDPRLYLGLVRERGWSDDQYREWLAQQLESAMLR